MTLPDWLAGFTLQPFLTALGAVTAVLLSALTIAGLVRELTIRSRMTLRLDRNSSILERLPEGETREEWALMVEASAKAILALDSPSRRAHRRFVVTQAALLAFLVGQIIWIGYGYHETGWPPPPTGNPPTAQDVEAWGAVYTIVVLAVAIGLAIMFFRAARIARTASRLPHADEGEGTGRLARLFGWPLGPARPRSAHASRQWIDDETQKDGSSGRT